MTRFLKALMVVALLGVAAPPASASHLDRGDRFDIRCDRNHDRFHDRQDRLHDRWHRRNSGIDLPAIGFPGHDALHDRLDDDDDRWHDTHDDC
jgi:hypothetical protein